jgi:hypothetical protein
LSGWPWLVGALVKAPRRHGLGVQDESRIRWGYDRAECGSDRVGWSRCQCTWGCLPAMPGDLASRCSPAALRGCSCLCCRGRGPMIRDVKRMAAQFRAGGLVAHASWRDQDCSYRCTTICAQQTTHDEPWTSLNARQSSKGMVWQSVVVGKRAVHSCRHISRYALAHCSQLPAPGGHTHRRRQRWTRKGISRHG